MVNEVPVLVEKLAFRISGVATQSRAFENTRLDGCWRTDNACQPPSKREPQKLSFCVRKDRKGPYPPPCPQHWAPSTPAKKYSSWPCPILPKKSGPFLRQRWGSMQIDYVHELRLVAPFGVNPVSTLKPRQRRTSPPWRHTYALWSTHGTGLTAVDSPLSAPNNHGTLG